MKYVSLILLVVLFLVIGCSSGFNGVNGVNGNSCTATTVGAVVLPPNGGLQIQCPGQNALFVSNGANGNTGLDGTQISTVQFCPGATSYPSEFNEIGICIGGNIYAVYSANDGFLTQIVPGSYNSNAIGSSCNFTVLPNCVIQN